MPRMIAVEVNETKHAYRINGVTFAKKRLRELFSTWGDNQDSFYRYLVIMPFFAEARDVEDAPSEAGKYAIAKAKRIQNAVGIFEEAIPAFMEVAGRLGHIETEDFGQIADQCHDKICTCGQKKSPQRVDIRVLH